MSSETGAPGEAAASGVVRASGCVVWALIDGDVRLLLAHRPRYDDWSFPKGKCEPGESDEECAVREVEEEVSVRGELGEELPPARYVDHKGRDKVVRYWLMQVGPDACEAEFEPNEEVDVVRWVGWAEAAALLSYDHDRALLAYAADAVAGLAG